MLAEPDCPGQLFSSLAACRRDRGAQVLSLATLWPRPKLSIYILVPGAEEERLVHTDALPVS